MNLTDLAVLSLWTVLAVSPRFAYGANPPASRGAEIAECRAHLEHIYTAIQAYRKENKRLPDYFHDLVPRFLSDSNVFLCPAGPRDRIAPRYSWLRDPTLPSHYLYEFSARPCEETPSGGPMTMAEWKSLQMSVVGGIVPLVRCGVHDPVLNIGFDGRLYESPPVWEDALADQVDPEDLRPPALRLRLVQLLQTTNPQTLAFDRLDVAASKVNRMAEKFRAGSTGRVLHPDLAARALAAADLASTFQKEYPKSDRVGDARSLQRAMIWTAAWAGDTGARRSFDDMVRTAQAQGLPVHEQVDLRLLALVVDGADGKNGAIDAPARALIKEFPKEPAAYWFLLSLAQESPYESRRTSIAEEILKLDDAPAEVKQQARTLLEKTHR